MKCFQKNGVIYVDTSEVEKNIKSQKFIGLNKNPRAEKIIISMTSFPRRINDAKYAVYSLLNQNFPADMVILWLAEEEFPKREKNLPADLLAMIPHGLTLKFCKNLLAYKKLIPALEEYPDSVIVTADDDLYYNPDWLKILYEEHLKFPQNIISQKIPKKLIMNQYENLRLKF